MLKERKFAFAIRSSKEQNLSYAATKAVPFSYFMLIVWAWKKIYMMDGFAKNVKKFEK
jgi:hypothetical protein